MSRLRQAVPSALTCLGMTAGLASVFASTLKQYDWAAWLILWSVLLDKADGTAAKLLGAESRFGAELDSLADFLSFGLAPALLTTAAAVDIGSLDPLSLGGLGALTSAWFFVVCAAIRLARFNVCEHPPGERYFCGIPTTSCGIIVGSSLAVFFKHRLPPEWLAAAPCLLALLGLGMISNLPVPKVLRRKNRAFDLFQAANIVVVYVLGILRVFPEYMLGLALIYLLVGVGHGLVRGGRSQENAAGIP